MLKVLMKNINIWIKYLVLISILILGQVFLLSFNEQIMGQGGYVRFNTQFVKEIQIDRRDRNRSSEKDFYEIWAERQSFIVRQCAKLRNVKSIKNIETNFAAKDKRFRQQIDLRSFLVDNEKQNLYYWNRNIADQVWARIINQTENLNKSNPKSLLYLQEAMAFYKNIILGILLKYSIFYF